MIDYSNYPEREMRDLKCLDDSLSENATMPGDYRIGKSQHSRKVTYQKS